MDWPPDWYRMNKGVKRILDSAVEFLHMQKHKHATLALTSPSHPCYSQLRPSKNSQLQRLPTTNSQTENGCVLEWPSRSGKFSLQPVSGYVLSMCFGGWTGQTQPQRNSLPRPRPRFSTASTAAPAASSRWTTASWPFRAARCKDVSPQCSECCWFDRSMWEAHPPAWHHGIHSMAASPKSEAAAFSICSFHSLRVFEEMPNGSQLSLSGSFQDVLASAKHKHFKSHLRIKNMHLGKKNWHRKYWLLTKTRQWRHCNVEVVMESPSKILLTIDHLITWTGWIWCTTAIPHPNRISQSKSLTFFCLCSVCLEKAWTLERGPISVSCWKTTEPQSNQNICKIIQEVMKWYHPFEKFQWLFQHHWCKRTRIQNLNHLEKSMQVLLRMTAFWHQLGTSAEASACEVGTTSVTCEKDTQRSRIHQGLRSNLGLFRGGWVEKTTCSDITCIEVYVERVHLTISKKT